MMILREKLHLFNSQDKILNDPMVLLPTESEKLEQARKLVTYLTYRRDDKEGNLQSSLCKLYRRSKLFLLPRLEYSTCQFLNLNDARKRNIEKKKS